MAKPEWLRVSSLKRKLKFNNVSDWIVRRNQRHLFHCVWHNACHSLAAENQKFKKATTDTVQQCFISFYHCGSHVAVKLLPAEHAWPAYVRHGSEWCERHNTRECILRQQLPLSPLSFSLSASVWAEQVGGLEGQWSVTAVTRMYLICQSPCPADWLLRPLTADAVRWIVAGVRTAPPTGVGMGFGLVVATDIFWPTRLGCAAPGFSCNLGMWWTSEDVTWRDGCRWLNASLRPAVACRTSERVWKTRVGCCRSSLLTTDDTRSATTVIW